MLYGLYTPSWRSAVRNIWNIGNTGNVGNIWEDWSPSSVLSVPHWPHCLSLSVPFSAKFFWIFTLPLPVSFHNQQVKWWQDQYHLLVRHIKWVSESNNKCCFVYSFYLRIYVFRFHPKCIQTLTQCRTYVSLGNLSQLLLCVLLQLFSPNNCIIRWHIRRSPCCD